MNNAVVADLKQFIATEISQQTAHLASKTDIARLATKLDFIRLEKRIDEIHEALEQSAIDYTGVVDEQVQDHEKRLRKLEKKAA
jgi:hypothetical protein